MPAETHVEQGPLGRDEIFEIVRDRLADILEIEPATISEGQSFVDDLDADSLALIELVEALEEELGERTVGFRIEDEDLEDLKTVRDAVDYVHDRVGLTPAGAPDARRARASGSATSSPTPRCCASADGPPLVVRRASRRRSATSASSSSATPCSAGSSPTSSYRRYTELPEGAADRPAQGRRERARRWPRWPSELDLGAHLLLGRGEDAAGGREKPSILSDALEAVLGAVYLDGGPAAAYDADRAAARRRASPRRPTASTSSTTSRALQELAPPAAVGPPEYVTSRRGPRPRQAVLRHGRSSTARSLGEGDGPVEEGGRAGRGRGGVRRARRRPTPRRCLSCPRSRPSGAGWPSASSGDGSSASRSAASARCGGRRAQAGRSTA